jgi:hypothetical protein
MYASLKKIILCLPLLLWGHVLLAQKTYTVKNLLSSGNGSFSAALDSAQNDNKNSVIEFNIPIGTSTPIIRTDNEYFISHCYEDEIFSLVIDGTTQPTWKNIIFEKANVAVPNRCFVINRSNVSIYGLHIRLFSTAILIEYQGCPVSFQGGGIESTQVLVASNINIGKAPVNNVDYGNTIVSNSTGILVDEYASISNLFIRNNYIGTDKTSSLNIGNTENIYVQQAVNGATTSNIYIEENVVAGGTYGVLTGRKVTLRNNFIGTNKNQSLNLKTGIGFYGHVATERSDIQKNVFANNNIALNSYSIDLQFKENIFYCNGTPLILGDKPVTPTITVAQSDSIRGTGQPFTRIDLFYSNNTTCAPSIPCQGKEKLNTQVIFVEANGIWSFKPSTSLPLGRTITAQSHLSSSVIVFTRSSLFSTPCATILCSPPKANFTKKDVSCNGGSDGSATILPTTAGEYLYRWKTTEAATPTNQRSNLTAGNYIVTITNSGTNCSSTLAISIAQPSVLGADCLVTRELTTATNDATASVRVFGGTQPYTLVATNTTTGAIVTSITTQAGGTRFILNNLTAGDYSIVVTDSKYVAAVAAGNNGGCTYRCTFTISKPACNKLTATLRADSVVCAGESDGTLYLTFRDSALYLPLGIKWSYALTIDSIRTLSANNELIRGGLSAGQYFVTITDKIGCSIVVSTKISQPDTLYATCDSTSAALKIGEASGSAWIGIKGGSPNFIINISQGPTVKPDTIVTSNGRFRVSGLKKGKYLATVLFNRSDCYDTCSFTIDDPVCTLRSEFDATEVFCFNASNGTALLKPDSSSGKAPFTYKWAGSTLTTPNRTGLKAGDYIFTVTDSQLCTYSDTITITQPNILATNCLPADSTLTLGGRTGQGKFTFSGGTKPFFVKTYFVSTNSLVFQKDSIYSDSVHTGRILPIGNYRTDIIDGKGCAASCTFTVFSPKCGVLTTKIKIDSLKCFNDTNASITVSVTGGTPPYKYFWRPNSSTDSVATNLGIGSNYTARITDANGCIFTTNPIVITQPTRLTSTFDTTKVTRFDRQDGAITVRVSGGTQPYTVKIGNDTIATALNATTFKFSNLATGNYTYVVTDANGCKTPPQLVMIEGPICLLKVKAVADSVRCNGGNTGTITLTATDGIGNLTYSWVGNNSTTNVASNLTIGVYQFTVVDGVGCQFLGSAEVFQPTALRSTFNKTNVTQVGSNDGTINVKVTGGTPQYQVQLNGQNALFSNDSFRFTGLATGNYTYTVTDNKRCTTTGSVAIDSPSCKNLTASIAQTSTLKCFNDKTASLKVSVTGGTKPYKYIWNQNIPTDSIANNLGAGPYIVTVSDNVNCKTTQSIIITQPTALTATYTKISDATTNGGSEGSFSIKIQGGTRAYSAQIKIDQTLIAPTSRTDSTFLFDKLKKGTYFGSVTDANGCAAVEQSVTITSPSCSLTVASRQDSVKCKGQANGSIILTPTGGTNPLTFKWDSSIVSTTNIASNLKAGVYRATVTDALNCPVPISQIVLEPAQLTSTSFPTDATRVNGQDGSVKIKVTGGTPSYTVKSGLLLATRILPDTFVIRNLAKGTYPYEVTDAKQCPNLGSFTIKDPDCTGVSAQLSVSSPISCFGLADGAITVFPRNFQTPQYNWSGGLGTVQNPTNVKAGTYTLTITDGTTGCKDTSQITITDPPQIKATLLGDTAVCAGQSMKLRFVVSNTTNFSLVFSDGTVNTTSTLKEVTVTPTTNTTYKLVSVQSGACIGVVEGTAKVDVTTVTPLTGIKVLKDSLCLGEDISLSVTPSVIQGIQYIWETPSGIFPTPVPNLVIPNSVLANSGLYTVRALVSKCTSSVSTSIPVTIINATPQMADAGADKVECNAASASTLGARAILGQNVVGRWTSLDGATIAQPTLIETPVSNLKTGSNRFLWVLTSPVCRKEISRDTVDIFLATKPVLTETQFTLGEKQDALLINIKELLKDTAKLVLTLTTPNIATVPNGGRFIVFNRGNRRDAEKVEIAYQVCPNLCPNLCEQSRLFITVSHARGNNDTIVVPSIINLGDNSTIPLTIEGLQFIEKNEFVIVDRWGTPVFGPVEYENNSLDPQKAWYGDKNGKPLPSGAYYWMIRDKDKKFLKGIQRGIIYLIDGQ